MATSIRQRNLFAAEDFRVVYESFRQANFQAYDYDSIRTALVDYIRQQYPENFNDWIQSSEFVAILETLAFLAHSLAFRIDQAGRENFLSTAERRESVLRIADFLGYTPARHQPARGELKIVNIRTTQDVFDTNGQNLKNTTVDFEDSFQNFLLVMNELLPSTHKFGRPTDSTRIGSIKHDIYSTNIAENSNVVFPIFGDINSIRSRFEVHSIEINDITNTLQESEPDPNSGFNVVYKNDGQGLGSDTTGFFVGFKQGSLQFTDVNATRAIPNLIMNVSSRNVNNSDVWVQEINSNGAVQATWTKVDSSFGANTIFNNIRHDRRKLYSVKTVENDDINVHFGDGVFSEIPRGTIRIWYRTGLNQAYTLDSSDIGSSTVSFQYIAADGNPYTVTFTCELQEPINNAASQESISSIKNNAGRVFAAQDRMIAADDYSVYPLTVSENVKKIKAVNRTYAGHSRFIKTHDPTATYQNVDMIADDGYLYSEKNDVISTVTLPTTLTEEQIYERYIEELIAHPEAVNRFYENNEPIDTDSQLYEWQQITQGYRSSTGYLTETGEIQRIGQNANNSLKAVRPGSIVEFIEQPYHLESSERTWVRVIDVLSEGQGISDSNGDPTGLTSRGQGAILLNKAIPNTARITRIFPAYSTNFIIAEANAIIDQLVAKESFDIEFDVVNNAWRVFDDRAGLDDNRTITVRYNSSEWTINAKRIRYVFGSNEQIRFYNQNGRIKFDSETNKPERDRIVVSKINTKPNGSNESIGVDSVFFASRYYTETDGHTDDHKMIVTLSDIDNDNYPDDPLAFKNLVGNDDIRLGDVIEDGFTYRVLSESGFETVDGRENLTFKWRRVSNSNFRIDPSPTNMIDIFVLNQNYDSIFREWLADSRLASTRPSPPSEIDLRKQFISLKQKKAIGDTIIYHAADYKILFGELADIELQGRFKVVKVAGTTLTNNEIKSRILTAINEFFDLDNWEFGETFYFTELSAFIHQKMPGIISSIVVTPIHTNSAFGDLFQIVPDSNELFIPNVTLQDIDIVDALNL